MNLTWATKDSRHGTLFPKFDAVDSLISPNASSRASTAALGTAGLGHLQAHTTPASGTPRNQNRLNVLMRSLSAEKGPHPFTLCARTRNT